MEKYLWLLTWVEIVYRILCNCIPQYTSLVLYQTEEHLGYFPFEICHNFSVQNVLLQSAKYPKLNQAQFFLANAH